MVASCSNCHAIVDIKNSDSLLPVVITERASRKCSTKLITNIGLRSQTAGSQALEVIIQRGDSNMNEEKPWLLSDDQDGDLIVGNKSGLIRLKDAIDKALENNSVEMHNYISDSNIYSVILRNKEEYLNLGDDPKTTILQKIGGIIAGLWFIALPFVAVALILFSILSEKEKHTHNIQPLINAIKNDCENKF